ncbi:DUF4157 domain-containing protein [Nannocystaceae bacterium ST9]
MLAIPSHADASKHARAPATVQAESESESQRAPRSGSGWIQMATRVGAPKRGCACGGTCAKCKGEASGIPIGPAHDAFEHEADHLAARMVSGDSIGGHAHEAPTLRTKSSDAGASSGGSPASLPGLGGGRPLPASLRAEFGPRLGRSLDGVRVHTDGSAHAAADALGARAFTYGRDLVFGAGEWSPISHEGRQLIAHELVHWAQQGGMQHRIQRRLKIDTAASDDPATAIPTITPLLGRLCDGFTVQGNGEITSDTTSDCGRGRFDAVSTGARQVGCCCLCTLVRTPHLWKIIVSTTDAPTTNAGTRIVRMTPTGARAPDFRYWTGGPTQQQVDLPPEEAFGHELCGHAALMEIQAHPSSSASTPDRAFSDIHDPTVKVENALAGEMGLAGPRRGLAGSGSHRGESLRVFTIQPFNIGSDDPTPAAASMAAATSFMNSNARLLVDVVGFHTVPEVGTLGLDRARRVQADLASAVTVPSVPVETPTGPTPVTRIQPAIDGGFRSPTVEVRMAARPAGLELPPGPTPASPPVHVGAEHPATARALIAGRSANACHNLLARIAWAGATP